MAKEQEERKKDVKEHVARKVRRVAEGSVEPRAALIDDNLPGELQDSVNAQKRRNADARREKTIPPLFLVEHRPCNEKVCAEMRKRDKPFHPLKV